MIEKLLNTYKGIGSHVLVMGALTYTLFSCAQEKKEVVTYPISVTANLDGVGGLDSVVVDTGHGRAYLEVFWGGPGPGPDSESKLLPKGEYFNLTAEGNQVSIDGRLPNGDKLTMVFKGGMQDGLPYLGKKKPQ